MAGVLGFEPRYAGIKTPCLTAWRRPKLRHIIDKLKAQCQPIKFKLKG